MRATLPLLEVSDFPELRRDTLTTLQVNLGYRCNQQCVHCHVNAGPKRKENMTLETVQQVIEFMRQSGVTSIDLTGGAPELNPHFRDLVDAAVASDIKVIDRCNITVLEEPGQENLADFLADRKVEITASLPCYMEDNVDQQRGKGVFQSSIRGLQALNALGYGQPESGLQLNLVYNPQGWVLPPAQAQLEADYKNHLQQNFDIVFNQLFTITNMPIQRFGSMLVSKGQFHHYMMLLKTSYAKTNLPSVMCRSLMSVDWQGYVYDCDFNQMLGLPLRVENRLKTHINDLLKYDLNGNPIAVADHCYGCTAGSGSSCGGALS